MSEVVRPHGGKGNLTAYLILIAALESTRPCRLSQKCVTGSPTLATLAEEFALAPIFVAQLPQSSAIAELYPSLHHELCFDAQQASNKRW